MTRYSIDPDRHELIAAWGTGEGNLATRIAVLPADGAVSALLGLSSALTQLSDAAWRSYTHPADAAGTSDAAGTPDPDTDGPHREREDDPIGEVARAIAAPNPPRRGAVLVSSGHLLESAHRVGRTLHDLADPRLTEAVLAETATELAAVEAAELGDLTGRAQQAVLLSREDASPVQVAAADRLLEQDPFGPAALFSAVDPTAAAVAAAHWLAAAVEVTAQATGLDPVRVLQQADAVEPLAHETPAVVLGLIETGVSPYDAVTGLVRHAMQITEGLLPIPVALRDQVDDTEEDTTDYPVEEDPGLTDVALRLTPLDPRRPARSLLEVLVGGIHACWLIHAEYAAPAADPDTDPDTGFDTGFDGDPDGDPAARDGDGPAGRQRRSRDRFARLVRATAARHRGRLV
ncbi:hypothetical protein ACFV0O_02120 [Kitasatospora sp. NPDC059577]|uniref:hypothetical protein n=1 Tax=Kitasatospora sp. NPDC059577 TaxID=3346873 RepID=UPI0036B2C918